MTNGFDWYAETIQVSGPPQRGAKVDPAYAQIYRGRLPDFLLRFWTDFGFGAFGDGMLWLCDPALLQPVMDTIFAGDPEIVASDMLPFAYTAEGEVRAVHPKFGAVTIDAVLDLHVRYHETALSAPLPLENTVGGDLAPPESLIDDNGDALFPQAVARLGPLQYGEAYGFFPALRMGGALLVENLRKVAVREHLLFLAQIDRFRLDEYFYRENDPQHPFGSSRVIRPIGRQAP